jgi:glycosyltransferase involved in cell wall biosynthesis
MLINNVCDGARLEITKNASIFMSVSHDEGFGMPAAEARSLGVKLVLADIPIYREIHGHELDVTYVSLQTPPENWIKALEQSLLLSNGDKMWLKKFEDTRLEQLVFFVNSLNSIHLDTK